MSITEPRLSSALADGIPAQPTQAGLNDRRLAVTKVNAADLHKSAFGRPVYSRVKRAVDVATVVLVSPAVLVSVVICAALILVLMGRPIFFVQNRVGRNGRVFRMYKLRSMQPRPAVESVATAKNDPRITPLGRFLRLSHLGELPQLWNALRGDMTLIGPRPEQPELVTRYAELIPHYELRHLVTPGLSGWAQVFYGYAADVEETRNKLEYDLFYVQHFGPATDLRTLIRTIVVYSNPMYVR